MNRKSITSIDIFTGTKKRISFKNDVKKVGRIYNIGNKKLIILTFKFILNEKNEYEYQSRVILYDIESDTYKLIIMKKDEFIDKVLIYSEKPYFMVRLPINKVNKYYKIYTLNDNECLEEYNKQEISLEIIKFLLSSNGKYFMMIDENNAFKAYDSVGRKIFFSYKYDKKAFS